MTLHPAAADAAATPAYESRTIDLAGTPRSLFPTSAGVVSFARKQWDVILLVSVALAVFQPWNSTLLSPQDFSSPIMQLGVSAQAWYWTLFAVNCAVLGLAREFFLRTGVSRKASFVGLALWATMAPTAEAWVAPSREMFGMLFLLSSLLLALNYADAPEWRRRAFLIAFGVMGLVLSKAGLAVLVPVIVLVACVRVSEEGWSWATRAESSRFLLVAVSGGAVAALALTYALTHVGAQDASSAEQMRHPLAVFMHRLEVALVPASPRLHRLVNIIVDPGWTLLFVLPNLLWIRLVAGGIVAGRRKLKWPLIISGVWVSAGLLLYVRSAETGDVNMLPFAFGAMFGAAHALTAMLKGSRARILGVMTAGAVLVVASSLEGRTVVYSRMLRARLYSDVIGAVASNGNDRMLIGATPAPDPVERSWAKSIARFGAATSDVRVSGYQDLNCKSAREALSTIHGAVVVSTGWGCGKLAPGSTAFRSVVPRYQWPWLWEKNQVEAYMYVAMTP